MEKNLTDYEAWLAKYKKRGEELEAAIGVTIFKALENSKPLLALPNLCKARASFPIKFCLLLYSTRFDAMHLREVHENSGTPLEDEEIKESQRVAAENLSEAAAVLMPTLSEVADTHLVLFERDNDEATDSPVRLRPPDDMWFAYLAQVAELAHAIVVIDGTGEYLMQEVRYLSNAGLRDRMLIYTKGKLLAGHDADNPRIWQLNEFGEAIKFAAASEPGADSVSFIEDPVLPGWFVDGIRERFEPDEPPA